MLIVSFSVALYNTGSESPDIVTDEDVGPNNLAATNYVEDQAHDAADPIIQRGRAPGHITLFVGQPYQFTATDTSFSLTSTNADWLKCMSLYSISIISGTPTVPGKYTVSYTLRENLLINSYTYEITVLPDPYVPQLIGTGEAPGDITLFVGQPYQFTATDNSFSFTSTNADWLKCMSLYSISIISGTPTVPGKYTVIYTLRENLLINTYTYNIIVLEDPHYVAMPDLNCLSEESFEYRPYTKYPQNLSIEISNTKGLPIEKISYDINSGVVNFTGIEVDIHNEIKVTLVLLLNVNGFPLPRIITFYITPVLTIESQMFNGTQDEEILESNKSLTSTLMSASWQADGLPPGLSVNSSGGISGKPTVSGVYFAIVTATSTHGKYQTDTKMVLFDIGDEKPRVKIEKMSYACWTNEDLDVIINTNFSVDRFVIYDVAYLNSRNVDHHWNGTDTLSLKFAAPGNYELRILLYTTDNISAEGRISVTVKPFGGEDKVETHLPVVYLYISTGTIKIFDDLSLQAGGTAIDFLIETILEESIPVIGIILAIASLSAMVLAWQMNEANTEGHGIVWTFLMLPLSPLMDFGMSSQHL